MKLNRLKILSAIVAISAATAVMAQQAAAPPTLSSGPAQMAQGYWQIPDTPPAPLRPAVADAPRSCDDLAHASLPEGMSVSSVTQMAPDAFSSNPWCKVTVRMAHPPAASVATAWIGLPLKGWNGRFLGLGGGGWQAGFVFGLAPAVGKGFAVGITDAGHPLDGAPGISPKAVGDASFVLDADGRLDWSAVRNFAYLGVHDMTVVGKSLASSFYAASPRYAYFSGCSTAGRQGQSEVQRFPGDYDGVLSAAPAINWTHFLTAAQWSQLVMHDIKPVAKCKLEAARAAAVTACDGDDGLKDGVVNNPYACHFDPRKLIGTHTPCGTIDSQDAEVIRLIWDGPHRKDGAFMWFPQTRGTTFDFGGQSAGDPLRGVPNPIVLSWLRYYLKQNPQYDPAALDHAGFEQLFDQALEQFGAVMDTSNPDISAFAGRGGKTLIWHGLDDSNFPAAGSIHYVKAIKARIGAPLADKTVRLFLAPGNDHCGGGAGPNPTQMLDTLMNWVEKGQVPEQLVAKANPASALPHSGLLCAYPRRAVLFNPKAPISAASYRCE